MMRVLRLSLRKGARTNVIVCICRGVSDTKIMEHIERGATTLRDLQRCGVGDQCGSCHNSLRAMLAAAAEAREAVAACPACTAPAVEVAATA